MKHALLLALALGLPAPASAQTAQPATVAAAPMPYAAAGLTAEQAAAHLLSRFAFGPRPGEAPRVAATGLDVWFEAQLADAPGDDPALARRLAALPAAGMDASALAETYPRQGRVLTEAVAAGAVARPDSNRRDVYTSEAYRAFVAERGYRPERELGAQLVAQKILRAVYTHRQVEEAMTDFWFNHFNVAGQDGAARPYLLPFERDAIRPNALGRFRDLLGATAKHPAMLHYLDNAQSVTPRAEANRQARRPRGVNENYARELLELHTLGVDGGYTQADVEAVARALTGWTVWPSQPRLAATLERQMQRQPGIVRDGLFLFRPAAHDRSDKTILGRTVRGGGLDEGERVLDLVAAHPSTARHLARKIAVRFVSDAPPDALVDDLARVFTQSGGDVKAVLRGLVHHPAFWSEAARQGKVKSPFELAVSAVRAADADVTEAGAASLAAWIGRMGQPLYRYQAPTGFPDRADAWLSAGTVAARLTFGLRLATGAVPGVRVSARGLLDGREPASMGEALDALAPLVVSPVQPFDRDALVRVASTPDLLSRLDGNETAPEVRSSGARRTAGARLDRAVPKDTSPAAQALGVLLGSPAFQHR